MDYEEKIRLAKEALNSGSYDQETIEYIFPELKDSRDEKIRKALINHIDSNSDTNFLLFHEFSPDEVIAWLEKQGEPNPYSGTSFKYNGHTWGMCARDNGVEILIDGQLKCSVFTEDTNTKEMFIKALERVEEENSRGNKLTDCDKNSWWEDFKQYIKL